MKVMKFPVGPIQANCYIVACDSGQEAVVIDPGDEADRIFRELQVLGARCKFIVNTHGHVDHIGGNGRLRELTGAAIAIHQLDAGALKDPTRNLSAFIIQGEHVVDGPAGDILLKDGDELEFGGETLSVMHTPGHTPGSICLIHRKDPDKVVVFTGDTLFCDGIGRTDFPGGDPGQLENSLKTKLFPLPETAIIYPGHGPESTIGAEAGGDMGWR